MSWRGFWQWVDEDFNEIRPWSLLLAMLVICGILMLVFMITSDETVREWAKIIGAGSMLFVVLPYYLYRSSKNLVRVTKESIQTIRRDRAEKRKNGRP